MKRSLLLHHHQLVHNIARKRDQQAFAELFSYYAPRLHAYLLKLGGDSAMADEVTQDTMMVLWHKTHLFDPDKSSLSTWLFRVARNRRIDLLRKDRSSGEEPDLSMVVDEGLPEPGQTMDEALRREKILQALNDLSDEQKELVRLSFFDDLSHVRIAEVTGIPLGTVKSRIRAAFARLRYQLEQDDQVDAPGKPE
jgi:RNA polymerase sigma factor (sigma-70 family)